MAAHLMLTVNYCPRKEWAQSLMFQVSMSEDLSATLGRGAVLGPSCIDPFASLELK